MGQLPKYKIKALQKAKRDAKASRRRKINTRRPFVSFLIVCEGEKTEPNYFKSLIDNRISEVREVEIDGTGCGTVRLIKEAIKLRDQSGKDFDRVWAVFDKDDFMDFNGAIALANHNKIKCAWTNEAFELWYYLHFQYLDTGVSRADYIKMLEREIRILKNESYSYKKNDPLMYDLLQKHGNEEFAINNARKLRNSYAADTDYAAHKPCTTVDQLVNELSNPEDLL